MPGSELIGEEEAQAVQQVFQNGGFLYRYSSRPHGMKSEVDLFEEEFAQKIGVSYAHAVSSGTSALVCALKALGVKPGDEVITQSHTFIATVEAIIAVGATPVITEVNDTLNMDPVDLKKKITEKTKVIIPVHMMGVSADMDHITSIARDNDIFVLEDNAQACGGTFNGLSLGTLGDIGITSFDTGKVITTGEGGMVYSNDERYYTIARSFSDHGHEFNPSLPRGRDTRSFPGLNCKMMELQGALGRAQLQKLPYVLEKLRYNKRMIKEGIKDISGISFRRIPNPEGDICDAVVFYLDSQEHAEKFAKEWYQCGFHTKNLPDALNWHFAGTWDHLFPIYNSQYTSAPLWQCWPESSRLLQSAIAISVMVKMTKEQIEAIIQGVHDCCSKAGY